MESSSPDEFLLDYDWSSTVKFDAHHESDDDDSILLSQEAVDSVFTDVTSHDAKSQDRLRDVDHYASPELPSVRGDSSLLSPLSYAHDVQSAKPVSSQQALASTTSHSALKKIERIFESLADSLLRERDDLVICLSPCSQASTTVDPSQAQRVLSFPARNAEEGWRFCLCMPLSS